MRELDDQRRRRPARRARSRSIRSSWPRADAAKAGAEPVRLAAGAEPRDAARSASAATSRPSAQPSVAAARHERDRRGAEERRRRPCSRSGAAASPRSAPRRSAAGRARSRRGRAGTSAARASARARAGRRASRTAATSRRGTRPARSDADHGLVEARRPRVDDVEVTVRIGRAPLHFGSYTKMEPVPTVYLSRRVLPERCSPSSSVPSSSRSTTPTGRPTRDEFLAAAAGQGRPRSSCRPTASTASCSTPPGRSSASSPTTPSGTTTSTRRGDRPRRPRLEHARRAHVRDGRAHDHAAARPRPARVSEGDRLVRAGTPWILVARLHARPSLEGQTLGIVGLGRIGREVARLAEAFGMRVVYASRRAVAGRAVAAPRRSSELLATADVVTLHCPLTARDAAPDRRGRALGACARTRSSSTRRAARSSTRRRSSRLCARARSPAPRSTSTSGSRRCTRAARARERRSRAASRQRDARGTRGDGDALRRGPARGPARGPDAGERGQPRGAGGELHEPARRSSRRRSPPRSGADGVIGEPEQLRTYECDGLTGYRVAPGARRPPADDRRGSGRRSALPRARRPVRGARSRDGALGRGRSRRRRRRDLARAHGPRSSRSTSTAAASPSSRA